MNRRDALKIMGGSAALYLMGADFHKEEDGFPVAWFDQVVQDCPERLYDIFGEGSTITQPRLTNGDEILGEWKPCTRPQLNFDAALSDHLHFPLPSEADCLSRSNLVFIYPDDAFLVFDKDGKPSKICGVVKMTQVRWRDAQVTGINVVDRTWRLSEEDMYKPRLPGVVRIDG
jgi:hypothetical protein